MKHLAAMNVISESGADSFVATPLSKALTEPRFRDGITYTLALLTYLTVMNPDSMQISCRGSLFPQDSRLSQEDQLQEST